jgi:hypothetical protein
VLTGEDLAQALDVVTPDQGLAVGRVITKAVDQLSAQDVDLAVEDAPAV